MTDVHDLPPPDQPGAQRAKEFAALPEWLQRLATESWQVELLISGFAIVGSTQLVGLIEPMAERLILYVRIDYLMYLRWALYYLAVGFVALPAIFVAHFGLRTYWVGLVSLSSVYPHGFGSNYGAVPEWVARDTERRSPALAEQIARVERRSSIMFAVAALSTMMFASIAVGVALVFALGFAAERLSGGGVGLPQTFAAVVGVVALLYLVNVAMLLLKRYHDRPAFRRAYLRLNVVIRKTVYTIFERPAVYLSTLLTTNVTSWRSLAAPLIFGYVALLVGVFAIVSRPGPRLLLSPDELYDDALRLDRREPFRYRAEWTADLMAVHPSIEREVVDRGEGPLLVSLPLIGEDDYWLKTVYPLPDRIEDLPDTQRRRARRAYYVEAAAEYWRLSVDGERARPESIVAGAPGGQDAGGYLAYLDVSDLAPGPHVVELSVARDSGYAARAVIPFRLLGGR